MLTRGLLILLFGLVCLASQAVVASVSSDDIVTAIQPFMDRHTEQLTSDHGGQSRIDYEIRSLDSRLALAACATPLVIENKSAGTIGRINLKVSCEAQARWSIYVPVEVSLFKLVVISAIPVAKGDTLDSGHLDLREMNVSRLNGTYYSDFADVVGMQARRPLKADRPVIAQHIEPPVIIKRGESVLMTATSSGLVVKIPGIALKNGRKGQQISVRNKQSNRIVEAIVKAPGQVSVTM